MDMHLQLSTDGASNRLEVDGVDITAGVLAEGFSVALVDGKPIVKMTVRPDTLTVEGQAVVKAALTAPRPIIMNSSEADL